MRLLTSPSSSSISSGSESDSNKQIRIGRIKKASQQRRQRFQLMNKLRTMVPNAWTATTQLELLQFIIDYIFDLQQLVSDDADGHVATAANAAAASLKQNTTVTDLSLLLSKITTANTPATHAMRYSNSQSTVE